MPASGAAASVADRTHCLAGSCGLTFELSGSQRWDARPGLWKMLSTTDRAWWHAVGSPLERGVRPQCLHEPNATWQGPWRLPGFLAPERETASWMQAEVGEAHVTTCVVAGACAAATRLPNKLTIKNWATATALENTFDTAPD